MAIDGEYRRRAGLVEGIIGGTTDLIAQDLRRCRELGGVDWSPISRVLNDLVIPNIDSGGMMRLPKTAPADAVPIWAMGPGEELRVSAADARPTPMQYHNAEHSSTQMADLVDGVYSYEPTDQPINTHSGTFGETHWWSFRAMSNEEHMDGRPVITLNGAEEMITDVCIWSVLVHELSHARDVRDSPVGRYRTQGDVLDDSIQGELYAYMHESAALQAIRRSVDRATWGKHCREGMMRASRIGEIGERHNWQVTSLTRKALIDAGLDYISPGLTASKTERNMPF